MGIANVVKKSIVKALRDVAITIGSIGAIAGLTALEDPEVLAPIVAVVPGPIGVGLLLVVPIATKALIDAIKHKDQA